VKVRAHDPAVKAPTEELLGVELTGTVEEAMTGADVCVLATPWPEYRTLTPAQLRGTMNNPFLIDPTHFLAANLAGHPAITYSAVGRQCTVISMRVKVPGDLHGATEDADAHPANRIAEVLQPGVRRTLSSG
jgi:hypothetical protein